MSDPRSRVDRWLSLAAGVGAICAVAVSLHQAALAREQQRASAWPYLAQADSHAGIVHSSLGRGRVLPPGAARTVRRLPPGEQAFAFRQAAQARLETAACHCSIHDECWRADTRADTRADEPVAVPACREDSTVALAH